MKIGIGIGIGSMLRGVASGQLTFYVRPTGSTYGTGDGSSYANAWSGFPAVNQSAIVAAGGQLAICGTHYQTFTVSISGLTIIGNDANEAGIIDGQDTRVSGIIIDGYENVTISDISIIQHTIQNVFLGNGSGTGTYTNIVLNRVDFSDCTNNQGVQCWGITGVGGAGLPTATFNYCTGNNNADEGISVHQNGDIVINGGQYKNNVNAFVNVDTTGSSKTVTINDVWDTSGNGVDLQQNTGCTMNVYRSRVRKFTSPASSTINFYDSYVLQSPTTSVLDNVSGTLRFRRCILDGTGTTATASGVLDMQSGSTLLSEYTSFINTPGSLYPVLFRSGMTLEGMNNCIVYGGAVAAGRAFFVTPATTRTVTNCIILNTLQVDNAAGITYNYCSITNAGTVNGTQTNSVNSDPEFTDPANLDFSLQAGSPMIGAGLTISGIGNGILTADWGSATESPTITSGAPNVPPDIGAYIN